MTDEYIKKAIAILGTDDKEVTDAPFGRRVIKKAYWPSPAADKITIYELPLTIKDLVLFEGIVVIERNIPIRSHEEVREEIVCNVGETVINYVLPNGNVTLCQGAPHYSVRGNDGFFHGFTVEKTGLLYFAKAVHPDSFVNDYSFKIHKNTFKPKNS